MNWNRATTLTAVLCALATFVAPVVAQDGTDEDEQVGFFGNRFALFVEAATGATDLDDLNTTIDTGLGFRSINTLTFEDFTTARFTVGWKLPFDRGSLAVVLEGYREDGYRLEAIGQTSRLATGTETAEPLDWWFVTVEDGTLESAQFPPSWSILTDDTNGNGLPDREELVYGATPATSTIQPAAESIDNTWQTVDLLYRREFGGARYGGRWSGGLRYFSYEGNVLAPAWIGKDLTGFGYTEGGAFSPLSFPQTTEGYGPTGSIGFVSRFFRERLELSVEGRAAFVLSTLETDSGDFLTTVAASGPPAFIVTAPARVTREYDKDVWQVGVSVGLRWHLFGGLSLTAEYSVHGYHDAVVVATDLTIPERLSQINRGTGALFDTTDLRFDGWKAGLGFQF
jgi:hypothetical protein